MLRVILMSGLILAAMGAVAQTTPPEAPPGVRVKLSDGQLFLPEGFKPEGDTVPLTLHLHGAAWAAERNQVRAKQPGVLVSVVLPGLSAVYTEKFRDPKTFQRILIETAADLKERFGREIKLSPITVTSFSAGYGGVREMLKDPTAFERLDRLVLADSLYAGFTGDPEKREVDPANMEGFLRFAREAVAGRKRFILTHTQLFTPTYASTVDTADYLLRNLEGAREPVKEAWPGDLILNGRFKKGGFALYSFDGDTGPEHMKHLHGLWIFLSRLGE